MAVDQTRIDTTSPMGATLAPDGTGFRTWAPNANGVAVVAGARLGGDNRRPPGNPNNRTCSHHSATAPGAASCPGYATATPTCSSSTARAALDGNATASPAS